MRKNGWEIIGNKIKFKYENFEWKQTNVPFDLVNELDKAKAVCGDTLNACWLDSYHYTLMKQTPVTNDLYLFIANRGQAIGNGFRENFWNGINTDLIKESLNTLFSLDLNTVIFHVVSVFEFIIKFI